MQCMAGRSSMCWLSPSNLPPTKLGAPAARRSTAVAATASGVSSVAGLSGDHGTSLLHPRVYDLIRDPSHRKSIFRNRRTGWWRRGAGRRTRRLIMDVATGAGTRISRRMDPSPTGIAATTAFAVSDIDFGVGSRSGHRLRCEACWYRDHREPAHRGNSRRRAGRPLTGGPPGAPAWSRQICRRIDQHIVASASHALHDTCCTAKRVSMRSEGRIPGAPPRLATFLPIRKCGSLWKCDWQSGRRCS